MNYTDLLLEEYLKEDKASTSVCPICGSTDVEVYNNTNYNDPYKDGAGHNGSEHTNAVYYKCNKCGCRYYDWTRTISYDGTDLADSSISVSFDFNEFIATINDGLKQRSRVNVYKKLSELLANDKDLLAKQDELAEILRNNDIGKASDEEVDKLVDKYMQILKQSASDYNINFDRGINGYNNGAWDTKITAESIEDLCNFLDDATITTRDNLFSIWIAAAFYTALDKKLNQEIELEDIYKMVVDWKNDKDKYFDYGIDYIEVSEK